MRTLDEVIKGFECCKEINCAECPYANWDKKEWRCNPTDKDDDALYYLKEFKRISARLEKIALGNITETLEKLDNPALTWDELKQMKGKPVWVVEEGCQTWEYWSLVYWMKDDELTLLNENGQMTYSKNEQGTVWQAYRKEHS